MENMGNRPVRYFSLFSGIGGFELGIQQAYIRRSNGETKIVQSATPVKGLEACQQDMGKLGDNASSNSRSPAVCTGFSEIDKYAIQIYKNHFPTHKEYGDVSKITWADVKDFNFLVGGFPCQSFSIAGKRRGFDDTRGTMFFEIERCLRKKQPRLLLLENVKGLLSHDKGRTFGVILNTLDELGYDLQWQVLNSKNFGVPQNRERVFIVGHLRGTSRPKVFPIGGGSTEDNKAHVSKTIRAGYYKQGFGGQMITEGTRIRRLTPTECERLQGFPDGWTEGVSDTQRYKCIGNAVTVNVIEVIVSRIFEI